MTLWLFKILSLMPLVPLRMLGRLLGLAAQAAGGPHARRQRAHWQSAAEYLQVPHGKRSVWRTAAEAGLLLSELPFIWCRRDLVRYVDWPDAVVLDEAVGSGKGVILLTPHLGGFELIPRMVARRQPLTVLYRPAKQAWLERILVALRPAEGVRTLPATSGGVRGLLRELKAGRVVGLLPDQVPGEGEGILAPFMGRPALTMTLAIRLAQATGAPLLWIVARRRPGGWTLACHRWDLAAETDLAAAASDMNRQMEELISRVPHQYLWSYNRYKKAPTEAG